jgi:hypothetical protein
VITPRQARTRTVSVNEIHPTTPLLAPIQAPSMASPVVGDELVYYLGARLVIPALSVGAGAASALVSAKHELLAKVVARQR